MLHMHCQLANANVRAIYSAFNSSIDALTRCASVADRFLNYSCRWLWVPASAGTTKSVGPMSLADFTVSSLRTQGPPRERNALIATPRLLDVISPRRCDRVTVHSIQTAAARISSM